MGADCKANYLTFYMATYQISKGKLNIDLSGIYFLGVFIETGQAHSNRIQASQMDRQLFNVANNNNHLYVLMF